jgi:DNA mismatch endonuclease (patch repair protein)
MRYRVDVPLPFDRRRRADIFFPRVGLFVFIDGCFWHGCPDHYVEPQSNPAYWRTKLVANAARDADTTARLIALGFRVLRIWEHEPAEEAAQRAKDWYDLLRDAPAFEASTFVTRSEGSGPARSETRHLPAHNTWTSPIDTRREPPPS